MMRFVCVFACAAAVWAQTGILIDQEPMDQCDANGLALARIRWASTVPAQIRVGAVDGPAVTGLEPAGEGATSTGKWVQDRMVFLLVSAERRELARGVARIFCPSRPDIGPALRASDFLPLEVGNTWVYAVHNRQVTGAFVTWRVVAAETAGDTVWHVIEERSGAGLRRFWARNDAEGRVLRAEDGGVDARVWADPVARRPGVGPVVLGAVRAEVLGFDSNALGGLVVINGQFARGIGFLNSTGTMITGSSGGFYESMSLVHARLAGGSLVLGRSPETLEISAEAASFDVTGRRARNCAVPCYFIACGLTPGADPEGTYKPCFEARVESSGTGVASLELRLLSESGATLFVTRFAGRGAAAYSVPLYSEANRPLPPGSYQLEGKGLDTDGLEVRSARIWIELQ